MKIVTQIGQMQEISDEARMQGKKIGVVPTMGYLHQGHLSLIQAAKRRSDIVITTLFVNPAQFAPNEDFLSYPRDFERDKLLAGTAGSDHLFVPSREEIYPPGFQTYVTVEKVTAVLEGKSRPDAF